MRKRDVLSLHWRSWQHGTERPPHFRLTHIAGLSRGISIVRSVDMRIPDHSSSTLGGMPVGTKVLPA